MLAMFIIGCMPICFQQTIGRTIFYNHSLSVCARVFAHDIHTVTQTHTHSQTMCFAPIVPKNLTTDTYSQTHQYTNRKHQRKRERMAYSNSSYAFMPLSETIAAFLSLCAKGPETGSNIIRSSQFTQNAMHRSASII